MYVDFNFRIVKLRLSESCASERNALVMRFLTWYDFIKSLYMKPKNVAVLLCSLYEYHRQMMYM